MLSLGIVGLPNVGKSTLFNALTQASALVANYPFATIEPNTGVVEVPDERIGEIAKLMVVFLDHIAGDLVEFQRRDARTNCFPQRGMNTR